MSVVVTEDSLPEEPLAALSVLADTEMQLDRCVPRSCDRSACWWGVLAAGW